MPAPTPWIHDRLPTEADADSLGMVRWGPDKPGMLMAWDQVRYSEPWTHSSAWRPLAAYWVTELIDRTRTADHLAYGTSPEDARSAFLRDHPEAEIIHIRPVVRTHPVPEPAAVPTPSD